ncbi:reverse transcriptase domain-containing protein [uncultured Tateyamaria sp.]|uniref:reverse transcriptase domain-containing protein n=1 Tax=uncultured Tateyamaria sp. TaxID=455651 RepID=UPI00261D2933|nr:reverse transcriptase domain-containing protein [uncultured Tateyamaria sp.]
MPGLSSSVSREIDWHTASSNVLVDARSDFILAPHFDLIFREKSDDLIAQVAADLASGHYEPQLPISISVPKPGLLTRPGSILLPKDRLIYQALIQDMLTPVEQQFDRSRSFSHVPSDQADRLFEPSYSGWSAFQRRVEEICNEKPVILQCDVANYFETLPQHNLINALEGASCRTECVRLLEKLLLAFREKSSQGIVQGIFPSDVLGNFYLTDADAHCALFEHPSARYVDDIYIGFDNELGARSFLVDFIESLRSVGLTLNATKTRICRSSELLFEQREVDTMFQAARGEVETTRDLIEEGAYGFQGDWINSDDYEEAINEGLDTELLAVRALIAYDYPDEELAEKIDRFSLPYLRASGDDFGVERAFQGLEQRPHLIRHYFSYLNHFARTNPDVQERIEALIVRNGFYLDYQRMYYMAGVLTCQNVASETVAQVMTWYRNRSVGRHTRALAAIFTCKFGSARERREVRATYSNEDPYVRAAILYGAQFFTNAEKRTMKTAWNGHSELNSLIAAAI